MQKTIQCQKCDPTETTMITDIEAGEIICAKCGIVASQYIETQKNLLVRNYEHINSYQGTPSSLAIHDKGLSTTIGISKLDSHGNILDSKIQEKFNRLRKWDKRLQIQKSSRNLTNAFRQLDALKDKLSLSDVVAEKTAYIYRRVQQDGLVRGRKINAVLGASLYLACREFGIPRSIREIIKANNGKYSETARAYRQIILHLDIKIPQLNIYKIIEKVGRNANIEEKNIRIALKLMKKLEVTGFSAGRDPMGLAGAILYVALTFCTNPKTRKVTQSQIAQAAGVSEVTIRATTRQIYKRFRSG